MTYALFSSESVTEGHPDKICDQIADAVLDAALAVDPGSRVACEVLTKTGFVLLAGEITTRAALDLTSIARGVLLEAGYDASDKGLDGRGCAILTSMDKQSPDIAAGIAGEADDPVALGAGDQGMMFGYACTDTPEAMPLPIALAHRLTRGLAEARKSGRVPFLFPDGKAQVSVRYDQGRPVAVDTVVVSTQHHPDVPLAHLRDAVMAEVVEPAIPAALRANTTYHINPAGRFVLGGPAADAGLTGRKIMVDTYGGWARHGGGAFSGKDPSKVDRSASYYARYMAKNIVVAGLARQCEVQLAYAIGVAEPVSVAVSTFGTGVVDDAALIKLARTCFDARPAQLVRSLDLLRPLYRPTATYGHFGRLDVALPWEKTDKIELLQSHVKGFAKTHLVLPG